MDIVIEAMRLRLDVLAVEISQQLSNAAVPHALLKGPSTANWLYDPPRRYTDVDVLVPLSRVHDAVRALASSGVASARAGRIGEESEHSLLMLSAGGFEVDLHISLPTLAPDGDRLWNELDAHVVSLDLGVGQVPALDVPARCLVLALHALNSGRTMEQPFEDLRRALDRVDESGWREARELAGRVKAGDLFEAGLQLLDRQTGAGTISGRAYLLASGAPSEAIGLQRLSDARRRDLPRLIWREILPTRGFMRRAYPQFAGQPLGLLLAHAHRWRRIAGRLPSGYATWRAARR